MVRLRCAEEFSRTPLRFEEYEYIAGKTPARFNRNGELVGIDTAMIDRLVSQVNTIFLEGRGSYSILSYRYRFNQRVKDDAMVQGEDRIFIARADSDRFREIKAKLEEALENELISVINSLRAVYRIPSISKFLSGLVSDLLESFTPNVIFFNDGFSKEDCSQRYNKLKALLLGGNADFIHGFMRAGHDLYQVILDNRYTQRHFSLLKLFLADKTLISQLSRTQLEQLKDAAKAAMFASFFGDGESPGYAVCRLTFTLALIHLMAEDKKLELWGRIYFQYDFDPYLDDDEPRELIEEREQEFAEIFETLS